MLTETGNHGPVIIPIVKTPDAGTTMSSPTVRKLSVGAAAEGQRIDNFLLRELRGLPKTRLYRLLRKGEIRVNGGRVKPVYRLKAGDELRLPPLHGLAGKASVSVPPKVLERLRACIIHEDDDLLVLDKPSGLAVHGGSGLAFGVIEALRVLRPEDRQLELVHRLDRETSGCLLVARRRSHLRELHALIRDGGLEKRYLALVAGRLPRGATPVEAELDVDHRQGGERTVRVVHEGKAARSVFRRLRTFDDWSLADVTIDTGRTHQIRVHASHIGHPLAGDSRYGDESANGRLRKAGLNRLFLHASALTFTDAKGRERRFEAPLPVDLAAVVDTLSGDKQ
ncbi:23S rRNA pseudouridine955/2504/2580 synthase [Natronocella acetinitrilica]|uniref:Pseudouridine synthase n=1 Tax=Natronocella acetinitrilica TaxID=414046 RepID=A0AAE3G5I4_9GAMM|nr:23S rRNA pseudouridine955/2504/2580 synthase [Natronocella acetinitrilica]